MRHCPTLAMLADFFTKPLQGHLFYKFRDALLGYTSVAALAIAPDVPLEERVGDRRIGTVDDATTGMHSNSEIATWADIVRLTPKDRTSEHTASKTAKAVAGRRTTRAVADKGYARANNDTKPAVMSFERSFSRNNSVYKSRV